MPKDIANGCRASGKVTGHYVENGVWRPATTKQSNLVMYDWAVAVSKLLSGSPDGKNYKIGGMYLEFANNGGSTETPPSFTRAGGVDYYNGLGLSATRDYLRVPVTALTGSNSDDEVYSGNNVVTVYAQTAGAAGVHGKTFSEVNDSRIFGCALVAYPVFADATQDLVLARYYFPTDEQLDKLASQEIGITWALTHE